jgi:hypothetical protein
MVEGLTISGEAAESLLIITGSMGAGKTTVLGEASDLLSFYGIPHAAIDVDMLGLGLLPSGPVTDDVMYENLGSVCRNYAAAGVRRFLVVRSLEDQARLDLCRRVIPARNTLVCRLTASLEAMQGRVRRRELGIESRENVDRVAKLAAILDRASLEDFTLVNENRPLTDVAAEMLVRAGWISGAAQPWQIDQPRQTR